MAIAKSPDNAEGSPDETASAHPDAGRGTAEQRLHNVADERADDEQQRQLVEAASFGEDIRLPLDSAFRMTDGICVLDTGFKMVVQKQPEPVRERADTAVDRNEARQLMRSVVQNQIRPHRIDDQQPEGSPKHDVEEAGGHQMDGKQRQPVDVPDCKHAQDAPQHRILRADVAVEVPALVRVVPPLAPPDELEQMPGQPFRHRRHNHAAEEHEEQPVLQLIEKHGHEDAGEAVDRTERPGQKAAVDHAPLPDGSDRRFHDPAQKRVEQEQLRVVIKRIVHSISFPLSSIIPADKRQQNENDQHDSNVLHLCHLSPCHMRIPPNAEPAFPRTLIRHLLYILPQRGPL